MLKINKILLLTIVCFCCFFQLSFGQNKKGQKRTNDFKEFYKKFSKIKKISDRKVSLNKWIEANKLTKNMENVMTGYQVATTFYGKNDSKIIFKYCDSILDISKESKKYNFFTCFAYLEKGRNLSSKGAYTKTLNYLLLALKYAQNKYMEFSVNYSIGILKDVIGDYKGALKIYRKNYLFAKYNMRTKAKRNYLASIYAVANSFNNLKKLDSAEFYNKLGIKESIILNGKSNYAYFVLNQGTTHYLKKEFIPAVDSLKKSSKLFKTIHDKSNEAEAHYYLGESYLKLNFKEKAIRSFKRVDTIFREEHDLFPTLRPSYEYLIEYYKKKNDLKNQLIYINQLIKLDSILHTNELYLNKVLIKKYDFPNLLTEKEKIIDTLRKKENWFLKYIYTLILVSFCSLLLFYFQNKKRKLYKKRFNSIINSEKGLAKNSHLYKIKKENKQLNIPIEISEKILELLTQFESDKTFLSNTITLQSLAKQFETNTTYLSKIINEYTKTTFNQYLNNLRVEYAEQRLMNDSSFRKLTIQAIADKTGFNNAESFSRAFFKNKGIKPSYFIRELNKREQQKQKISRNL